MSNVPQEHLSPPGGCGPRWDIYSRALEIFKEVIPLSRKNTLMGNVFISGQCMQPTSSPVIQFAESDMPKSK